MNYLFDSFDEVEESIKKQAPPVIYKYRADWTNKYHRQLLTEQTAWFAAPKELNDPYDIRIPVQFDYSEIEHPIFMQKLKDYHKMDNPQVAFTERDLETICENKLDEIRENPRDYFDKNYRALYEGSPYDGIGLFSCTPDELNETMWAHYGNNQTGFAAGFHTVKLAKDFLCSIGPVVYSDTIPFFSFIKPKLDEDFDNHFLKSTKWSYEKEYRFITIDESDKIVRAKKYSVQCLAEVLLGTNFPEKHKKEIINEVHGTFSKSIPIYQVQRKVEAFGLEKLRIA